MRIIEHAVASARGTVRRARSRLVRTDPEQVKPARLVIRLDDVDLPGVLGDGDEIQLGQWRKLVAVAVEWLGPVPVTILATHSGDHPALAEIIRFAHRLECPTTLVCDGTGIDQARAEELIDRGLSAVHLLAGGVSDEVQQAVVGNSALEATEALRALVAARRDREAALDLEVHIPWQGPVVREVKAVVGWARQAGADGVRIIAPWKAEALPADPELLDEVAGLEGDFNRTWPASVLELHGMVANQDGQPGVVRRKGPVRRRRFRCPVGGQRVEVGAKGRVSCCPFKAPIGQLDGRLDDVWSQGGPHLKDIASCDRACAHPELAPRAILSR